MKEARKGDLSPLPVYSALLGVDKIGECILTRGAMVPGVVTRASTCSGGNSRGRSTW